MNCFFVSIKCKFTKFKLRALKDCVCYHRHLSPVGSQINKRLHVLSGADHLTSWEGGGGGCWGCWVIWSSHEFFFDALIHNAIFFFEYALACYFFRPSTFCRNFLCVWMGLKKLAQQSYLTQIGA